MAFNQSNAVTSAAAQPSNDNWKAQGFLNFYLPTQDGKRKKLGAIALKESRADEKRLLAWLNEDPARAEKILANMIVEYRSATPQEGSGFALEE
jgi:hypothetical protein